MFSIALVCTLPAIPRLLSSSVSPHDAPVQFRACGVACSFGGVDLFPLLMLMCPSLLLGLLRRVERGPARFALVAASVGRVFEFVKGFDTEESMGAATG